MRDRLKVFGYLAIYWLSFQLIIRSIFLLYNYQMASALNATEVLSIFFYGFKMDVSLTGYLMVLTGLLLIVSVFAPGRTFRIFFNIVFIVSLLVSCVIAIVDVELYRHWGFRMNTTPLMYVGSEAIGSVSIYVLITLSILFAALFAGGVQVYWKKITPAIGTIRKTKRRIAWGLLALTALMFLPIRGSFTVAPMNTGFVYFHPTNAFANHAAINVIWNFMNSLRKTANVEYPENFFDKKRSEQLFADLYDWKNAPTPIFSTPRPNVILMIVESFTANVIAPLGGPPGIAPNLNRLCNEGVLFSNFYASGDRTDKGLISILSGYPAQPETSIIKFPAKTQRLPYLNHYMNELGYRTSFIYGGDIDFANFRSYLTACRFGHITTEDDFDPEVNTSKWGVHDNLVLERAFQETDTAQGPFFKVILTLSSHEPFDVPMKPVFKGMGEESLFLNSCYFTDSTIGAFVDRAKTRDWWSNTVIIIVADHGHRHPGNKQAKDKDRFRIPLLMIGGAIKKDTVISTFASQTDIANTLLAQLDSPKKEFAFSKDAFATDSESFATYFFNDGYGFVREGTYIVYDNAGKQYMHKDFKDSVDFFTAKAYQQILYSDYNKK